ncbi:MAG TPA: NAD(P)-dependent oxidoreductase [Bacteroidales bacterium]|nr:NAD(P)-dependent oxidoreductase [Bacteroidales bacterium]HRZ49945.1 NAD(P)-dependent oxidoreductase [Bacteroidales bacterium]
MNENGKLCIVVGANGYLGGHMVLWLKSHGYPVLACDRHQDSYHSGIPYQQLDILHRDAFDLLPEGAGVIYYFAGLTGTREGFSRYRDYLEVNELGLLNLLHYVSGLARPPRIVYPSTRLVYRGSKGLLNENDAREAKTVYAANKIAAELYLEAWGNARRISWSVCRICVPYGNHLQQEYSFGTIGYFIRCARAGNPIILYGDGSLRRTFSHVDDICRQLNIIAAHPDAHQQIYNIAGEEYTLLNAALMVAEKAKVQVEFAPWPPEDLLIESGDTVFDAEKISGLVTDAVSVQFSDWVSSLSLINKRS